MSNEKNIQSMFAKISDKYDFLNHLLSLGQDIIWRKRVATIIKERNLTNVADIACGTGDLSIEINRKISKNIIGVDFCYPMLEVAKRKSRKISLINGDGTALPLKSEIFDSVTIAFGIRNIPSRSKALNEFYRILSKGGYLMILEFDIPDNFIFRFYFREILPLIGGFFSSKDAYKYLPDSVMKFPRAEVFKKEIELSGFQIEKILSFSLGMVKLYIGRKF